MGEENLSGLGKATAPDQPGATEGATLIGAPQRSMKLDMLIKKLGDEVGRIKVATDTMEVFKAARELNPQLIILDFAIDADNKLCRMLKQNKRTSLAAVILMLPENAKPDDFQEFRVCADHYFTEPIDVDEVAEAAEDAFLGAADAALFFDHVVHFQLRTKESHIETAFDLIISLIGQSGFESKDASAVEVGFREALDNAARHGNKGIESKKIDVLYQLDKEKATITITDEGEGFDTVGFSHRGKTLDPVAAARERYQAGRAGGLGIMLMLKCVDKIEYNRYGNTVKLIKFLRKRGENGQN